MFGSGESQAERQWPQAHDEEAARLKFPADWQRYDFAATHVRGARVLDCACGAGYGTARLARGGAARVVGVDVAADALDWARAEYAGPSVEFRQIQRDHLPAQDGEFDCVVSFETIEHVAEEKAPHFVAELARVLRPGGELILSTPLTLGPGRLHPDNPFHLREYTPEELAKLLEPSFVIVEKLGQHSVASRRFAHLSRTRGLGALLRHGVHRVIPAPLRRLGRELILRPNSAGKAPSISAEDWRTASVQIVLARRA